MANGAAKPKSPVGVTKGPRGRRRLGGLADGIEWFTRTQAARYLGVTVTAIKRAQNRGALRGSVMHDVTIFARSTLDAYRASRCNSQLATQAYALLDSGKSPTALVSELSLSPEVAIELVASYERLSGSWVVAGPPGSRSAWCTAYGVNAITPVMLRRALELGLRTPSLRARLLE